MILHTWSHQAYQPRPEDDPPKYLRGWNHVELDADGNLFAVVPLRALLMVTPESELRWSCAVAAHHDLAFNDTGAILVLSEAMRRVVAGGQGHVVQDNLVTAVDPDSGAVTGETSLYDVLRTDQHLRRLIDDSIMRRSQEFRRGWPGSDGGPAAVLEEETREIPGTASYYDERRRVLQRLRDLPGKPCDVMHANTLAVLDAHPEGVWQRGDVMVCLRELDTIAAVDLAGGAVRWWWGAGELSGPHQPSMLPDGRVLIFDNGVSLGRTRLLVVDPSTCTVVWSWSADPPKSFFCPLAGGCERLPDGNLLVTDSTRGGVFELTLDGRVVWRMTLPVDVYGAGRGRVSIYRMSAVAPDLVGRLGGRDLSGARGKRA